MATQIMYDRKGNAVEVPTEQAADAYRSGALTFAEGDTVYLKQGRDTVAMGADQAAAALSGAQGRYLDGGSAEAYQDQELAREYGSAGGQAKALAAGAARGLSFGLSDVALSDLGGDETRTDLARLQRYNPGASMAGEAVGMVAPLLVSGGSGLLARGATSGVRGAAARGAAAVGAATRGALALGLREGGAAARAIGSAAGMGAETALYGAGSEISRQALANESLDGEKIVAAGLTHALLGAGLGAGGALVGAGARAVAGKALDAGTALAERATGRAVDREAATLAEKAGKLGETVAGDAQEFATRRAIKSTGLNQPLTREAEALPKEIRETLARQVTEDYAKILGREPGAILSHVEQAEAAALLKKQAGERLGAAIDTLDAAGAPAALDVAGVVAKARSEVIEPLRRLAGADSYAASVAKFVNDLEVKAPGMTFREFHANRAFLDDLLYEAGRTASPAEKALEKVRGIMEEAFVSGAEAAAAKAGKGFAAEYKLLKQEYRAAANGLEFTTKGAERDLANRTLGLSEQLGVLGGLAQGGVVGAASGAVVQNLVRKYGDQAAAQWARRVAAGSTWGEASAALVDQVIGQSVRGFFERAASTGRKAAEGGARVARVEGVKATAEKLDQQSRDKEYKAAQDRVAQYAVQAERVAERLPPGTPPATIAAAQTTAKRAADFLRSKVPANAAAQASLTPHLSKVQVSPEAQRKFLAYVRAVEDPASVLSDLHDRKLSREATEALRTVYPELYAQVQAQVAEELTNLKEPLPYDQARELGLLLGVVAHPAMQPRFIAAVQANYQASGPSGQGGGAGGSGGSPPKRPVNTARLYDGNNEEAA